MKIKNKITAILSRFKYITKYKFLYNKKSELKDRAHIIQVYYLMFEPRFGYSVWPFIWRGRKGENKSVRQWLKFIKTEGHERFTQGVIPTMNERHFQEQVFKDVIAWRLIHDIPSPKDSNISKRRHKTKS